MSEENNEKAKTVSTSAVVAAADVSVDTYVIRGTIKSIDLMERTFIIEPIPPYVFEKAGKDGPSEKLLLFVSKNERPIIEARIAKRDRDFKLKDENLFDVGTIVSLKTGREKVEIGVSASSFGSGFDKFMVESMKIV